MRSQTDKKSDVEQETKKKSKPTPAPVEPKAGPAVVKATKGRKLVAAGTADEVEILHEVEVEATTFDEDGVETTLGKEE